MRYILFTRIMRNVEEYFDFSHSGIQIQYISMSFPPSFCSSTPEGPRCLLPYCIFLHFCIVPKLCSSCLLVSGVSGIDTEDRIKLSLSLHVFVLLLRCITKPMFLQDQSSIASSLTSYHPAYIMPYKVKKKNLRYCSMLQPM